MLNKSFLQGRLTDDPVMRYTGNNTPVCSFSLAVERDFKNADGGKDVDFFNCVAWRGTGEFVKEYFSKGSMMIVHGRLQNRSYEDNNGKTRFVTEIVADNVYFGESKRSGTAGSPNDHEILQPSTFEEQEDDATTADTLPF